MEKVAEEKDVYKGSEKMDEDIPKIMFRALQLVLGSRGSGAASVECRVLFLA